MKKIIEGKFNLLISIVLYCLSVAIFLISQLSIVSGTFMSGSVFSYNYPLSVFVKRKCEQKGPKKVSTFSTRFHVVSNVFPKYQMLTF